QPVRHPPIKTLFVRYLAGLAQGLGKKSVVVALVVPVVKEGRYLWVQTGNNSVDSSPSPIPLVRRLAEQVNVSIGILIVQCYINQLISLKCISVPRVVAPRQHAVKLCVDTC